MALTKINSDDLGTLSSVTVTSVYANGSIGTNGQVLTSDGTTSYWSAPPKGDKGDAGTNGTAGVKGDKGDANGPKGDTGQKGDTGAAGAYDVSLNTFTGNGSNTQFTLSTTPLDKNHTIVTIYGVMQNKSTYSVTGANITFSEAPPNSAPIEITVVAGGAKGDKGLDGTAAAKGDIGPKGEVGSKGDIGTKGDKGDPSTVKGDKGDLGSLTYPSAGIVTSNGTAFGTSLTAPTGDVVGTSDTQTLTNKTITTANSNSSVADPAGNSWKIGYRIVPQVALSAANTAEYSYSGKHIYYTGAAATFTIPVDGATTGGDFEIGSTFSAINNGTANLTISIATGGTLYYAGTSNTGNRTLAVKGLATAIKVAGNTWFISGTGIT